MPEETVVMDAAVVGMMARKAGKKYTTKRAVQAFEADTICEITNIDGRGCLANPGDMIVVDDAGEIEVYDSESFKAAFKSPRTRTPKQPKPSRSTLTPSGSNGGGPSSDN